MGGSQAQLSIVLKLIDDASAQLQSAQQAFAQLGAGAAQSVSEAASSMTESFNATEDAAIAAAQASLEQWGTSASDTATAVGDSYNEIATMAEAAAVSSSDAWQASVADLQSALAQADTSASDDFNAMSASASEAGSKMESSISSIGGKIQAVGIQLGILGAGALAPVVAAIGDAADKSSALAQGLNEIGNVISGAGSGTENSTQIASLTAQINEQKAAIAEDDAALHKWTGTTVQVAAAHEKASAGIATAQVNIAKLQQELGPLTAQQNLVGVSAQAVSAQFANLATQNTNLGISFEDSYNGLVSFFNQTKSVTDATAEYGAAVDLVASGKVPDMTTAVQDVTQAFNGMGRGLQQIIPDMRDGVSGMDAVNQITSALAGSPAVAMQQYNTQVAALGQHMSELGAAMATGLLPALTTFLQTVNSLVVKLTDWATEHPRLAEALLIFLGLIGGILVLLGAVLVPFGLMIIGIEAFNTALIALNVTLIAAIGWTLLYVAAFVAIAAIVALIIVYHKQIMDAIKAAWDWIIGEVTTASALVSTVLKTWGADLTQWWTGFWGGIYSTLEGVWSKIESIISAITAAASKVGGVVSGIAGGVGSAVGGTIKAFASGGIVDHPTLALVGEAGPEAIIPLSAFSGGSSLGGAGGFGGGAGSINVYIQGGSYLDQGGAQQIANALATQIGRQLKLKNYF